MTSIAADIENGLPQEVQGLVRAAGRLASDRGQSLYVVGGTVRDLLLGTSSLDIDLVLQGDAPTLARQLAKFTGGSVRTHSRFGTATVRLADITVDIVTARSETYARPGALPSVKPGNIGDDLFRRDFTINCMAASVVPVSFGEMVDPHGGKTDLDRRVIRVLHERSFTDDPTRIWRAVRYEQRLGFRIERDTERLLRRDVALTDAVSGDRLRHEVDRILAEDHPEKCLQRAWELAALQRLSPSLVADGWLAASFERARGDRPDSPPDTTGYLALLAWRLDKQEIHAFVDRLRFARDVSRVLRDIPALKDNLPSLQVNDLLPSQICRLLDSHQPQAIAAAALATDDAATRDKLAGYLSEQRPIKPTLNGEDLREMGVAPGRKVGRILRAIRDAKLNGTASTIEDERTIVRRFLVE